MDPCRGCFVPLLTSPEKGGGGGSTAIGAGSDAPTHKVAHRVIFDCIQALLVPDIAGTLLARAEPVPMAHTLWLESHSL